MQDEQDLRRLESLYDALDVAIAAEDIAGISRLVESRQSVVAALADNYNADRPIPLAIRARLATRERSLQRDLGDLQERMGELLRAQGRRGKAAITYSKRSA